MYYGGFYIEYFKRGHLKQKKTKTCLMRPLHTLLQVPTLEDKNGHKKSAPKSAYILSKI